MGLYEIGRDVERIALRLESIEHWIQEQEQTKQKDTKDVEA